MVERNIDWLVIDLREKVIWGIKGRYPFAMQAVILQLVYRNAAKTVEHVKLN